MNAFMLLLCLSGVNAETEEVIENPSAKAYKTYCVGCHGAKAQGSPLGGPPLIRVLSKEDAELSKSIQEGKGFMPPYGRYFDDAESQAMVDYLQEKFGEKSP